MPSCEMARPRSVIADRGRDAAVLPCGWEWKLMLLCSNSTMAELKMPPSLDREAHLQDFIPQVRVHAHGRDGTPSDWVRRRTGQFPGRCSAGTPRGPAREKSTQRRAERRPHSQLG